MPCYMFLQFIVGGNYWYWHTQKKKKKKKKSKLVSKLVLNNCCIIFSYIGYVIVMSYLTYISKNDFSWSDEIEPEVNVKYLEKY